MPSLGAALPRPCCRPDRLAGWSSSSSAGPAGHDGRRPRRKARSGPSRCGPVKPRERLMEEYLAAWNVRDPERIAAFFTADAVYADTGAGVVVRGQDAIRAHVDRIHRGFGDLHFDLVRAAHADGFTAG